MVSVHHPLTRTAASRRLTEPIARLLRPRIDAFLRAISLSGDEQPPLAAIETGNRTANGLTKKCRRPPRARQSRVPCLLHRRSAASNPREPSRWAPISPAQCWSCKIAARFFVGHPPRLFLADNWHIVAHPPFTAHLLRLVSGNKRVLVPAPRDRNMVPGRGYTAGPAPGLIQHQPRVRPPNAHTKEQRQTPSYDNADFGPNCAPVAAPINTPSVPGGVAR